MEKKVLTIAPDDLLEDAIYKMRQHNVGVLPVLAGEKLVGMITNNDIFDAFLKITGYNEGGARITLQITEDHQGILAKITQLLADHEISILTVVVNRMELATIIEIQVSSRNTEMLRQLLTAEGFVVKAVVATNPH